MGSRWCPHSALHRDVCRAIESDGRLLFVHSQLLFLAGLISGR